MSAALSSSRYRDYPDRDSMLLSFGVKGVGIFVMHGKRWCKGIVIYPFI